MRATKNMTPITDIYRHRFPRGFWKTIAADHSCDIFTKKLWCQYFEDNHRKLQLTEDPKHSRSSNRQKCSRKIKKKIIQMSKQKIKGTTKRKRMSCAEIARIVNQLPCPESQPLTHSILSMGPRTRYLQLKQTLICLFRS